MQNVTRHEDPGLGPRSLAERMYMKAVKLNPPCKGDLLYAKTNIRRERHFCGVVPRAESLQRKYIACKAYSQRSTVLMHTHRCVHVLR